MIRLISSKAASILCKDDDKDTFELYEYAIYIILSGLFHVLTILVLGICFNMHIESLVFYGSFVSIRKFAGGYHAKTPSRCYLFSVSVSVAVLCLIKVVYAFYSSSLILLLLIFELACAVFIFFVSPLESENKPLNEKEEKLYRIVTRCVVTVLFVVSIFLFYFELNYVSVPIAFGVFMCALVLMMRKIQLFVKN